MMVVGGTKSGKTTWIIKVIKRLPFMFTKAPKSVHFYYQKYRKAEFDNLKKNYKVNFALGLPSEKEIEKLADPEVMRMIVIDDGMFNVAKDQHLAKLFTTHCNNGNLIVVILSQNLNLRGQNTSTIACNTHYIVLLDSPRNYYAFRKLGQETEFSEPFLREVYNEVMKKHYSTLVIDLHTATNKLQRIRTKIFGVPRTFRQLKNVRKPVKIREPVHQIIDRQLEHDGPKSGSD
jgi:hypothetical protein